MAIFRGVGGSGSSSDNSFLQEVTAQATTATTKANEASASATSAANSLAAIQQTEVTSASFNTGDGVLTLTKTGGATVTADLDGRFLTSYTETNDLSSAVTWANVPNANITESSVTQHLTAANVTSPLTGGTGISVASNGTITNDSPDQTVALTGTGATTITGTYPNFTINSVNTTYTVGDGGLTTNDFTNADHAKLDGIEANATADQTGSEIKSAYEAVADTNAFTDAEKTKLSGIEASADVTDTANVTAAGALMDSEVTNLAQVKAFDSSDYLTTHQDISGKANLSGATFTGDVNLGDSTKINLGASNDLQIYHDGSNSYIDEQGTGDLIVKGLSNIKFQRADTGTDMFTIRPNTVKTHDASGNTITKVHAGGLDVTGDLDVTGTVDGRDVSVDGARLDTIPYHRVKHTQLRRDSQGYNLGTTYTNIGLYDTIVHPATPVECARYLDLDIAILWNYVSSNTNDLFLQLQMVVPTGGGTVTNMGTATRENVNNPEFNTTANYAWYYVYGDYTHLFTEFGRINTTGNSNSSEGILAAWKYDSANNRTYLMTYDNPGVSFSTGDTFYYSPYAFESAGTTLAVTKDIDERYISSGRQPHSFKFKTAYDDAALTYKLQMKEYTTSDSGQVHGITVTFTDVEEL